MIVNYLKGGLGNQMFQWACGKNLSLKYNTELYLDLSYYNPLDSYRKFELYKFTNLSFKTINELSSIPPIQTRFEPSNFDYYPFPPTMNSNLRIDGYWQTEKFFKDSVDIIKSDFSISDEIRNRLILKYPNILDNSVSLHVRRTDYVISNGFHPLQDIQYYSKALSIIGNYNYIFVFSDDINWCKENIKFENCIFVDGNDNVDDLHLMSLCSNNIIANSSFSWWAAYLNVNPDKKIIYPSKWFGDFTGINTSLICPDQWIRI